MNPTITFKLETNPGRYTDMGDRIFLTSQTFRTATELLRARASVVGESRVTVVKGGM